MVIIETISVNTGLFSFKGRRTGLGSEVAIGLLSIDRAAQIKRRLGLNAVLFVDDHCWIHKASLPPRWLVPALAIKLQKQEKTNTKATNVPLLVS